MDEYIDQVIREVWNHYDPKATGIMKKGTIEKFFKVSDHVFPFLVIIVMDGMKEGMNEWMDRFDNYWGTGKS